MSVQEKGMRRFVLHGGVEVLFAVSGFVVMKSMFRNFGLFSNERCRRSGR